MAKSEITNVLIQTWENSLRDPSIKISSKFFSSYTAEQKHEEACYLFRYAFEKILDWSPYDALNYLNAEIVDKLNLRKAYNCFNWPEELDKGRSAYYYVAAMCYPDEIKDYGQHDLWIMEYNNLLSKAEAEEAKKPKNPRKKKDGDSEVEIPKKKYAKSNRLSPNTFTIENGYDKARFLLNHYLVNHPQEEFTDLETTYDLFSKSAFANKFLTKARLKGACKIFFGSPLEFFHQSLPNDGEEDFSRNDFLYNFTEFKRMDETFEKQNIAAQEDDNDDCELEDIFVKRTRAKKPKKTDTVSEPENTENN